jgi:Cap4 dsDNA endonuclease
MFAGSICVSRKPEFVHVSSVLQASYFKEGWRAGSALHVKSIEIVAPSEDVGRETVSRFDMQFQAAAYAALQILDGKGIDCIYCDYHDDFVVRRVANGKTTYHFFQVKTKAKPNHQWTLAEVFAFKKSGQKTDTESLNKIRKSFAGKLLVHGILFDEACSEATLLSNVHFNDEVITAVDALRGKAPLCKASKFLSDNFSAIFTLEPTASTGAAAEILSKLSLHPSVDYIGRERDVFARAARSAIYQYSEIDLDHQETEELANGLVDLVYRKSKVPLEDVAPTDISSRIGVGLDDLLEVLSISRTAYNALLGGVDSKVLKQASVMQRWLKGAGAREDMIEFASQQKVAWDLWLRSARHIYSPMDLAVLLDSVDRLYDRWVQSGSRFQSLNELLEESSQSSATQKFGGLGRELLFGAVSSVVVRRFSK